LVNDDAVKRRIGGETSRPDRIRLDDRGEPPTLSGL
jgi:hypothetical protein